MRIKLLAKRYARALFELADELKVLEQIEKDMALVNHTMENERLLRKVMANPVLDAHKKIKVLDRLFEQRVQKLTISFLRLITRKGRGEYIIPICQAFDEIYKDYKNIMPVILTTAYKPEEKIKKEILDKLAAVTEKHLEVSEKKDEDLIGGFKLDFEDYQYDNSIRMQLKRLGQAFGENLYISKL